MAQAARLNLRMQKELKLLLTDPPPSASFPCLSSESDLSSFSLTTIDAQIEGPEGTVYAKGVFNIKIQIPERYPFQPPSVTFATPIYHPNIDNGGRICLDILNLPPKGAWQPSMNISTVVTSIGLLLSEPNPDDGLMYEVSREYKYNRQAFDQKAQAMTEKYAQPGVSGNICGSQGVGSVSKPDMMDYEIKENESRPEAYQNMASNNKTSGLSRKLSLESMGQTRKTDDIEEVTETSKSKLFLNDAKEPVKVEGTKREFKDTLHNSTWSQEKVGGSRRKLSLEVLSQSQRRNDNEKENVVPNHCTSNASFSLSVADSGSVPPQVLNSQMQELHQFQDSKLVDVNIRMQSEKHCGSGQKQLFGLREVIDGSKEKVIATPQFLRLETGSKATDKTLPEAPAWNFVTLQPQKDSMSRIENSTLTTSHKKLHLVGKKLALGSRVSETQEKDYKENLDTVSLSVVSSTVPSMDKDYNKLSLLTKKHDKDGTGWIQSLGSPVWMEDTNENDTQLPLSSHSLFTNPLKHLPQQKDSGRDQKWQFDDDDNCKAAGGMRQQEEEKSSKAEATVVVDSEDSEEEKSGPSKTKPLVRKRLGRWRLRV